MTNDPKLSHKHKSIILNVFDEYKDVFIDYVIESSCPMVVREKGDEND